MKTSRALIIVLVVVILGVFALAWTKNRQIIKSPIVEQSSIEKGCYIAGNTKDVYTLNIQEIRDNNISGLLSFKNFEKDSSSGIFNGTYNTETGILLGDYAFQSEGTLSNIQVIFKKSGDNFIRGYGDLNQDGTRFTDIKNITYDEASPLAVFKKGECPVPSEPIRVTLSGKYVCLPHRDTTGPQTLECAFGLRTDGGMYALNFNLISMTMPNIQIGDEIRASGTLATQANSADFDTWQKYPIIGIFSVTDSLEKISIK